MTTGEFTHVTVDQIQAGGQHDIDAHKHQYGEKIQAQVFFIGAPHQQAAGQSQNPGNRESFQHGLTSDLGGSGNAEQAGRFQTRMASSTVKANRSR